MKKEDKKNLTGKWISGYFAFNNKNIKTQVFVFKQTTGFIYCLVPRGLGEGTSRSQEWQKREKAFFINYCQSAGLGNPEIFFAQFGCHHGGIEPKDQICPTPYSL